MLLILVMVFVSYVFVVNMPLIRSSIAVGKGWFKPTREVILPPRKAQPFKEREHAKAGGLASLLIRTFGAAFYSLIFGRRYRTLFSNFELMYPIRKQGAANLILRVLRENPCSPTLIISLIATGYGEKRHIMGLLTALYDETQDNKYAMIAEWVRSLRIREVEAECGEALRGIPDPRLCHVLFIGNNWLGAHPAPEFMPEPAEVAHLINRGFFLHQLQLASVPFPESYPTLY